MTDAAVAWRFSEWNRMLHDSFVWE